MLTLFLSKALPPLPSIFNNVRAFFLYHELAPPFKLRRFHPFASYLLLPPIKLNLKFPLLPIPLTSSSRFGITKPILQNPCIYFPSHVLGIHSPPSLFIIFLSPLHLFAYNHPHHTNSFVVRIPSLSEENGKKKHP